MGIDRWINRYCHNTIHMKSVNRGHQYNGLLIIDSKIISIDYQLRTVAIDIRYKQNEDIGCR